MGGEGSGRKTVKAAVWDVIFDFSQFIINLRNDNVLSLHEHLPEPVSQEFDEWLDKMSKELQGKSEDLQKLFDRERKKK